MVAFPLQSFHINLIYVQAPFDFRYYYFTIDPY